MLREFREKVGRLQNLDFQGHDRHDWLNLDMSDDEILAELRKRPDPELFLGRYTREEIKERLSSRGIFSRLVEQGYPDVEVEISTDQVYNHRLYVHTGVRDYDHILIELRLREGNFRPKKQFIPGYVLGEMSMIMVDFLLLQNPGEKFSRDRPPLPQQTHPGLGLLKELIPLVLEVVKESGRAGVLDVPEHFHGALFYSKWFKFLDPDMEGRFRAMKRDLKKHELFVVSECIFHDCLMNLAVGERESWSPGEQILPISEVLLDYFDHPEYKRKAGEAQEKNRYDLDVDRYQRVKREAEEAGGPEGGVAAT
ncbi:MAG: hypothetical protein R6V10_02875 [bacterium]